MTRTELIERLDAATEGSRDLDAKIALSLPDTPPQMQLDDKPGYLWEPGCGSINSCSIKVPCYTTSLDATETLWATPDPLPKRRQWRAIQYWLDYRPGGRPYWRARALECRGGAVLEVATGDHKIKTIAACIAALKARRDET